MPELTGGEFFGRLKGPALLRAAAAGAMGLVAALAVQWVALDCYRSWQGGRLEARTRAAAFALGEQLLQWRGAFDLFAEAVPVGPAAGGEAVSVSAMHLARLTHGIADVFTSEGQILSVFPPGGAALPPSDPKTVQLVGRAKARLAAGKGFDNGTVLLAGGGARHAIVFLRLLAPPQAPEQVVRLCVPTETLAQQLDVPGDTAVMLIDDENTVVASRPATTAPAECAAAAQAGGLNRACVLGASKVPGAPGWRLVATAGLGVPGVLTGPALPLGFALALAFLVLARRPAAPAAVSPARLAETRHDLRSLLLGARLQAENLQPGLPDAALTQARAALLIGTDAMLHLVEDLQSARSGALVRVGPRALLESVVSLVRPMADAAGLTLDLSGAAVLPEVLADRARLVQVMVNLLSNAARYAPGATVHIALTQERPAAPGRAGLLRLEIRDDGPGLPLSQRLRLCLPLQLMHRGRAREETGGEGLGLSVVRRLVAEMGGTLRVATVRGRGTAFRMVVPVRAVAAGGPAALTPDLSGIHVLVVEDSAPLRAWMAETLRLAGADVTDVADGRSALERAAAVPFDVALLDLRLGDLDGVELARQLGALPRPPRMVACSAHLDDARRAQCARAGISQAIVKSTDPLPLLRVVAKAAQGGVRPAGAGG